MTDSENRLFGFVVGCITFFLIMQLVKFICMLSGMVTKAEVLRAVGVYSNELSVYEGKDDISAVLIECDRMNEYAHNLITNGVIMINSGSMNEIDMVIRFNDAEVYRYGVKMYRVDER